MDFNDARIIDSICWQLRQGDYPRALNRARINSLFNGSPPYSAQEVEENEIEVNVNELSGTVAAHDARSQFYNAFLKPGRYFSARTDAGPVHKRNAYSSDATSEVTKIMKRSIRYVECFRSAFSLDVLHGIGPSGWENGDLWCPKPFGIEDVYIPANTLLTMDNLPLVAIYKQFTVPELIRLTEGPKRDPAWNMDLVNACIEWAQSQTLQLIGTNWPEIWSPEKAVERTKASGGFFVGDQVPTVDAWDFYFYSDGGKQSGWRRRIILDAWSQPAITASTPFSSSYNPTRRKGKPYEKPFDTSDTFLYNPKDRVFADCLDHFLTWQFADLSAVGPFRYHSVRGLGFLLYAVCHLQNRVYSKFNEALFEQLMMYFRVKSADEMQRALRVDLVHRGFIDDAIQFIPANERYQIRADLISMGMATNQNIIGRNSSSWTSNPKNTEDNRELTATQWMGEANKVTSLVSSALNQAYLYQAVQYREIWRRFTRKHSLDPDVRKFQARCLSKGIPPEILYDTDAWDIEPERVLGSGNRTLEMAIADRLLAARNLFDPEPQRDILRDWTLTITEDSARAKSLVPEQPQISDSVHDAQLASGTLMLGMPVAIKSGINRIDYIETMLAQMAMVIQKIDKRGEESTIDELLGLQNMSEHIGQNIQLLAQDPSEKQRVKLFGDQLGKMMNLVKRYAQMLQQKMQSQNGNGQSQDQETLAKIAAMLKLADAKAANTRESHAQRTAQRQLAFEMKTQQEAEKARQDLAVKSADANIKLEAQARKAAIEIEAQARKAAESEMPEE